MEDEDEVIQQAVRAAQMGGAVGGGSGGQEASSDIGITSYTNALASRKLAT